MRRVQRPDPLEANALIGRDRELEVGRGLLSRDRGAAALFLHGPGGIGKSALLAALAAEAEADGCTVRRIDGRDLPPGQEPFEDLLAELAGADRPLLAIDSFELVTSRGAYLRERLLPAMPPGSTLLLAGRDPPDPGWLDWPGELREVRLGPLADEHAFALLAAHGVEGDGATGIVAWAEGHPLALTLGARLAAEGAEWVPGEDTAPEEMVSALLRRLGETDVAAGHLPALGVAAIARSTTPALLAAALPGHDAEREWRWLSERSFVEPVGEGVALHALLREAVRADLRRREPVLEADLKRRIADHVYDVAERSGEVGRAIELSHLIDDPGLRWGFAWESSARLYVDTPRPGDVAEIECLLEADPEAMDLSAWRATRGFFARLPELAAVAKDAAGQIRGFTFVPTTTVEDAELEASPLFGPLLTHARRRMPRGEGVIMPFVTDLSGDPLSGIVGMLANAALLRASRSNPRYTYMTIREQAEAGQTFARLVGGERVPELDRDLPGGGRVLCWSIDFGSGGFLANQRELVYRELNLEPPPRPAEDGYAERVEQVREALRNLDSPVALARSPLAGGGDVRERAARVRERLTEATDRAFGDDPDEVLLREVLRLGYLDPAPSHEAAAAELYLSRSTYYRRLGRAVDRIAEYIGAAG